MSSQKNDREEVYIEPSSLEDQNTKGAFNSIFNLVNRKSNDLAESQADSIRPGISSVGNDLFDKQETLPILFNRELSRSNPEIAREQTKLQRDVHKSREIHRQLQNKKHRWRPSELELTVLKLHFEKNKYPSKEDKETILKNLELNFKSTIDMSQLNRWFQHEREKEAKHGDIGISKNTYKKFRQEDLDFLKDKFTENTYPKTEEMIEMAKTLSVNLSKIENWYKHNRRSLAKKGAFTLKTKKYFKKDEVNYLLKMFELYPRPTKEQILEMGQHLNCNELQIKNWYSNKRKKLKLVAKRQGVESQETKLHQQIDAPLFPQQAPQASDLFNNFPMMNTVPQVLPMGMGTVLPTTEQNGFIPTLASARGITSFQAPQVQNPYTNPMFPAAAATTPLMNSVIPTTLNTQMAATGGFPNGVVPILIIPASSTGLPLGQNNILGGQIGQMGQIGQIGQMPTQEMDLKNLAQPQQMLFGNNGAIKTVATPTAFNGAALQQPIIQPMMNQASAQAPNYNFFKQNTTNPNGMEIAGGNWLGQNQALQQTNPIIIVNKQPGMQNQPMSFNIQTQPTNFIQTNLNPGAFGSGNMIPTVFNSAGGNMTGFPSYEAPMQIQYLTSLYCPYSNNNIFSNYYPVVCPSNTGMAMATPEKQAFGAENGMMNGMNGMNAMNAMNGIQMNPQQVINGGMPVFNQGMQRPFDARIFATKNERDNDANKM